MTDASAAPSAPIPPAPIPPALAVSGLHKAFGDTAVLRGLDFSVSPGEFVAILGASGGGKTTLLRILCGFERADRGAVALAGVPVDVPHPDDRSADETGRRRHHVRPEHRRVGYVAQEGGLFPHLSVSANILFGLPRAGRADLVRAHALLDLVGLPHAYADRSPHSLSGGEQQRVALARALAPRPALVLLDEPFSALDAGSRAGTRQAVADALRESGATALLVTHDQGEALSMGNRIGVLRRGVLAQFATPDELYRRPADPELAAFVGEAVLLDASCAGAVADTPLGRIPLHPGAPDGPARILLRPEQIAISPPGTGNPEAVVASVAYYGHDAGVVLALSAVPETRLAARINGTEALALRAGDRVSLTVNGTATAFPSG